MIRKTYLLQRDPIKCTDCGMCSLILPYFLEKHSQGVTIPETNYNSDIFMRATIQVAIDTCPEKAITLQKDLSV